MIVTAVDGSEPSNKALEYAIKFIFDPATDYVILMFVRPKFDGTIRKMLLYIVTGSVCHCTRCIRLHYAHYAFLWFHNGQLAAHQ